MDKNSDMELLKRKKVGYYLGSFDPLHLGHQHVIGLCLQEGYVDYLLVYPAPGGDDYKNRTEVQLRRRLVASVYNTDWSPRQLQRGFSDAADVEILDVIGSDVVTDHLLSEDQEVRAKYLKAFMRGLRIEEWY